MEPLTIVCENCGNVYTAYVLEFAVCPKCGIPAIDDDELDTAE